MKLLLEKGELEIRDMRRIIEFMKDALACEQDVIASYDLDDEKNVVLAFEVVNHAPR
jgi:hypothetical protein